VQQREPPNIPELQLAEEEGSRAGSAPTPLLLGSSGPLGAGGSPAQRSRIGIDALSPIASPLPSPARPLHTQAQRAQAHPHGRSTLGNRRFSASEDEPDEADANGEGRHRRGALSVGSAGSSRPSLSEGELQDELAAIAQFDVDAAAQSGADADHLPLVQRRGLGLARATVTIVRLQLPDALCASAADGFGAAEQLADSYLLSPFDQRLDKVMQERQGNPQQARADDLRANALPAACAFNASAAAKAGAVRATQAWSALGASVSMLADTHCSSHVDYYKTCLPQHSDVLRMAQYSEHIPLHVALALDAHARIRQQDQQSLEARTDLWSRHPLGAKFSQRMLTYLHSAGDIQTAATSATLLLSVQSDAAHGSVSERDQRLVDIHSEGLFRSGQWVRRAELRKELALATQRNGHRSITHTDHQGLQMSLQSYGRNAAQEQVQCSVCNMTVRGSLLVCPRCGHGGHRDHLLEWFTSGNDANSASPNPCPRGCGCYCTVEGLQPLQTAGALLDEQQQLAALPLGLGLSIGARTDRVGAAPADEASDISTSRVVGSEVDIDLTASAASGSSHMQHSLVLVQADTEIDSNAALALPQDALLLPSETEDEDGAATELMLALGSDDIASGTDPRNNARNGLSGSSMPAVSLSAEMDGDAEEAYLARYARESAQG
jgi:hypothetical protein